MFVFPVSAREINQERYGSMFSFHSLFCKWHYVSNNIFTFLLATMMCIKELVVIIPSF